MTSSRPLVVLPCSGPLDLYHRHEGADRAQPAYIELSLRHGWLLASWDGVPGGGGGPEEWSGFVRRYPVPVLTGVAADAAMGRIRGQAARILADWAQDRDAQHNPRAVLGPDARAAEQEIRRLLGCDMARGEPGAAQQGFPDAALVEQWSVAAAVSGDEASDYGIDARTSDERLREVGRAIVGDLARCSPSGVAVVHGLHAYLAGLRADARAAEEQEAADLAEGGGGRRGAAGEPGGA